MHISKAFVFFLLFSAAPLYTGEKTDWAKKLIEMHKELNEDEKQWFSVPYEKRQEKIDSLPETTKSQRLFNALAKNALVTEQTTTETIKLLEKLTQLKQNPKPNTEEANLIEMLDEQLLQKNRALVKLIESQKSLTESVKKPVNPATEETTQSLHHYQRIRTRKKRRTNSEQPGIQAPPSYSNIALPSQVPTQPSRSYAVSEPQQIRKSPEGTVAKRRKIQASDEDAVLPPYSSIIVPPQAQTQVPAQHTNFLRNPIISPLIIPQHVTAHAIASMSAHGQQQANTTYSQQPASVLPNPHSQSSSNNYYSGRSNDRKILAQFKINNHT